MQPRLMRSRTEVIVAGVCGGLAEYFAIDPVIVRLIFVLVTLTSGIGLLVYPVLWLVMPKAGAQSGGKPAKRCVGDAGHWRQEDPVGDLNVTYFQWLTPWAIRTGHANPVYKANASSRLPCTLLRTILGQSSFMPTL